MLFFYCERFWGSCHIYWKRNKKECWMVCQFLKSCFSCERCRGERKTPICHSRLDWWFFFAKRLICSIRSQEQFLWWPSFEWYTLWSFFFCFVCTFLFLKCAFGDRTKKSGIALLQPFIREVIVFGWLTSLLWRFLASFLEEKYKEKLPL